MVKTLRRSVAVCLGVGGIDGLIFGVYYLAWGDYKMVPSERPLFPLFCCLLGTVVFGVPLFLYQLCWCRVSGRLRRAGLGLAVSGMLAFVTWRLTDGGAGLAFLQAAVVLVPFPFLRVGPWTSGAASAVVGIWFWGIAFFIWRLLWSSGVTLSLSDHLLFCPLGAMILATTIGTVVAIERSYQGTSQPSAAQDGESAGASSPPVS